jgi:hypothetical protein
MRSKKGFITSQMFIYAFGIIIVVLIVFAGYKAIKTFSSSAEDSGFTTLQAKFSKDMKSLASHKGEIKKFTYSVPGRYEQFCVFDLYNETNMQSEIIRIYPYLRDSLANKTENVFFLNDNKFYAFRSPELQIDGYPYYSCQNIKSNKISFSAKGNIFEGEQSALMLVSNIKEVDLTQMPFLKLAGFSDRYELTETENYNLISTDGLAKLVIPVGAIITMPNDGNKTISIKIEMPGTGSEYYSLWPAGISFSNTQNNLVFGVKKSDCATYNEVLHNLDWSWTNDVDGCEGGFVKYKLETQADINHVFG